MASIIPFPKRPNNGHEPEPPPPAAPSTHPTKWEACLHAIDMYEKIIEARPPKEAKGDGLRIPACSFGCKHCSMQCAIAEARIEWWEGELKRIGGVPAFALRRAV